MLRWEVLERRRENFYAYYWSLVGESNETALDYLKLEKKPTKVRARLIYLRRYEKLSGRRCTLLYASIGAVVN